MDDERIERALRDGPLDEPTYAAGRVQETLATSGVTTPEAARPRIWRGVGGLLRVAASIAVTIAVIGTLLLLRPQPSQIGSTPGSTASPDLLSQVRAAGRIRIAVRTDFPQASVRGSLGGFDVDVANELSRRLSLSPELVALQHSDMFANRPLQAWDIALPSTANLDPAALPLLTSDPYYYWPVYVLVPVGTPVASLGSLDGLPICTVAGSSGEAWLDRRFDPASVDGAASPPAPAQVARLASDAACLADVVAGRSAAMVTSALSAADIAARSEVRQLGGAVLTERRTIVARGVPDPAALLTGINRALSALRADGSLTDLSRRRFGGADLTSPTAP